MLTAKQSILRRFWHAVMPIDDLRDGPRPFRLMGEDLVLFLDAAGEPAALHDRCCHRRAQLSRGWCDDGQLVCAYHGWTYDRTGAVTRIPQLPPDAGVPNRNATAYRCHSRYGYAWVALDEPLEPLFDIPEEHDPAYRRIPQFYAEWQTAALRFMENSFDNAHFAFVHKGTFGNINQPKPGQYTIDETATGFYAEASTAALNPPAAYPITGSTEPHIVRFLRSTWMLPFLRRFDMEFPSGIRHIIYSYATPVDDDRTRIVQFVYRNDTEAQCPAQKIIDWGRRHLRRRQRNPRINRPQHHARPIAARRSPHAVRPPKHHHAQTFTRTTPRAQRRRSNDIVTRG